MSRAPLGITWDASHGRWKATVRRDGKTVHLGHYLRRETALAAAREARPQVEKPYRVSARILVTHEIGAHSVGEAKELVVAWYTKPVFSHTHNTCRVLKVTARKVKETKP